MVLLDRALHSHALRRPWLAPAHHRRLRGHAEAVPRVGASQAARLRAGPDYRSRCAQLRPVPARRARQR